MLKKRVLSILLVLPMMSAACKSGKNKDGQKWPVKVDVSDCYDIEIEGFNEKATLSLSRNEEEIEDVKDKTAKELKDEDMPYREAQLQGFFDSISFVAEPMGNLSNGDVIKIGVNWDESLAEKCSVEMEKTTFSYTVSGLKEVTYIDPFENLVVTISGVEGNPVIDIDNSGCSDIVKQNVKYSTTTQDSFLNIGETVTVQAEWNTDDKDFLDEYAMVEQSKEYVADAIDASFRYRDRTSASALDEYLKTNFETSLYPSIQSQIKKTSTVQTERGEVLIESIGNDIDIYYAPVVEVFYTGDDYAKNLQYPVKDLYLFLTVDIRVTGTIKESQEKASDQSARGTLLLHISNIGIDESYQIGECSTELIGVESLFSSNLNFNSWQEYEQYVTENFVTDDSQIVSVMVDDIIDGKIKCNYAA